MIPRIIKVLVILIPGLVPVNTLLALSDDSQALRERRERQDHLEKHERQEREYRFNGRYWDQDIEVLKHREHMERLEKLERLESRERYGTELDSYARREKEKLEGEERRDRQEHR